MLNLNAAKTDFRLIRLRQRKNTITAKFTANFSRATALQKLFRMKPELPVRQQRLLNGTKHGKTWTNLADAQLPEFMTRRTDFFNALASGIGGAAEPLRLAMERLGRTTPESPTARSAGTPENLENLFWRILDEYTL